MLDTSDGFAELEYIAKSHDVKELLEQCRDDSSAQSLMDLLDSDAARLGLMGRAAILQGMCTFPSIEGEEFSITSTDSIHEGLFNGFLIALDEDGRAELRYHLISGVNYTIRTAHFAGSLATRITAPVNESSVYPLGDPISVAEDIESIDANLKVHKEHLSSVEIDEIIYNPDFTTGDKLKTICSLLADINELDKTPILRYTERMLFGEEGYSDVLIDTKSFYVSEKGLLLAGGTRRISLSNVRVSTQRKFVSLIETPVAVSKQSGGDIAILIDDGSGRLVYIFISDITDCLTPADLG